MFEYPQAAMSSFADRHSAGFRSAWIREIDPRWVGSVLWHGRSVIFFSTAAGFLLALLYLVMAPVKFVATTQLLIDPTDLHAIGSETSPTNQASDTAVLWVESQVRVLLSDNVLRRVVAAEKLDHDRDFIAGSSGRRAILKGLATVLGSNPSPVAVDNSLAALNELKKRIQVKRADRTYVVEVGVADEDPAKAARLTNAVAQAYLAEQTQARSDAARQVSQSLTSRLNELRDRVRDAETRVENYKAANNIIGANGQLVNEQQLFQINSALAAARTRTAEAKASFDQIQAVHNSQDVGGAFPEALQSPTITALRTQYAEIMRREAEQMASLGERHPAVLDIEAQAERLRKMIDDEVDRTVQAKRNAYESAKADETILAHNLESLKEAATHTNVAMIGLRELERDVQASREVYQAFLVRARETRAQEQLDTKNIRVISRADLPLSRSSPPSGLLVLAAGLFVGAAAGTGVVFVLPPHWSDRRKHLQEPASTVPILALLPNVDVSFGLNAAENPQSHYAREIRKIEEAVAHGAQTSRNSRVLALPLQQDDAAVAVVLTLAALAASTRQVLLIDADLRRRTLCALDADQGDIGLVDVAVGRHPLADAILLDDDTNINLLPFVSRRSRLDRTMEDDDIRQALDQTRRYDMVIVAAPELHGDPVTVLFAGLVDHIILVARAEDRYDDVFKQFASRLGPDAQKIRGAVLTGIGRA